MEVVTNNTEENNNNKLGKGTKTITAVKAVCVYVCLWGGGS